MLESSQPKTVGLKQLYLRAEDPAAEVLYVARLYVEARIDFADVRSGLNGTCSVSDALEFYPFEGDDLWTAEMVTAVDPARIDSTQPPYAKLAETPATWFDSALVDVEARLLSHLLRSYHVTLLRNPALNVYSRFGEAAVEFRNRCLEMLKEPFRRELDTMLDTFHRSLEQVRERHLKDDSWSAFDRSRLASQNRGIFRDAADRITFLFISTELSFEEQETELPRVAASPDLHGRLASLEFEARHAVHKLVDSYRQKALAVDEYVIHPNFRDIHLVRACILWIPEHC